MTLLEKYADLAIPLANVRSAARVKLSPAVFLMDPSLNRGNRAALVSPAHRANTNIAIGSIPFAAWKLGNFLRFLSEGIRGSPWLIT